MKKSHFQAEKRQTFGIRKLNIGIASVGIATSLLFLAGGPVAKAEGVGTGATDLSNQSEVVIHTNAQATSGEEVTDATSQLTAGGSENSIAQASGGEEASVASGEAVVASPQENAGTAPIASSRAAAEETVATANQVVASGESAVAMARAAQPLAEVPVEEGSIRLHFENIDGAAPESQGLWTWGGVEDPSDGNQWPTDTVNFSSEQVDSYGHYVDLKKSATPGAIGYLVLKNGQKVTSTDQKIDLLVPEQNEAWIASDYSVSSYEPLKDENTLRINYKRDDGNYAGWGVWTWGDTTDASTGWPHGALDFQVGGKYGAYVDVPLSRAVDSNLKFLLVNQDNPEQAGNKTIDLSFADRKNHSQIFLRNTDTTIYTNPYFVEEKKDLDTGQATPGTNNVTVTASIKAPFNYNESGLVSLDINNPDQVEIVKMEVDTTAIGGGLVPVSTELNRVTIKATSDTTPGNYSLPVKVYDKDGGYYTTTVEVQITERQKAAGEKDWDEQVIYFMVTDRFYNGDTSNDQQVSGPISNSRGLYQGGDFKGVTAKLDYLKDLGVDSIWLTPIVENIPQDAGSADKGEYYAYHGYWAKNFEELNPHLGTLADFHELIDQAADRGINIIVDVVLNHAGYGTETSFAGMVRTKEEDKQGDDQLGSLAGLPDFKTEDATVRNRLVAWQASWLEKARTAKGNSIYAFRVDTVKHVDDTTWQHFKNELVARDADFHLIGETWGADYKDNKGDLGIGTMDSLLDFGFKGIAKQLVSGQLQAAHNELKARGAALTSAASLGQFLGSHDEDGFLYSLGGAAVPGNLDKLNLAATLLITAKGQPVIYYGEELGQSGQNNWPQYDNRYDFDWEQVATSSLQAHYQKLLDFRHKHSELLSRGDTETLAGVDQQGWLLSKRAHENQEVYILYSLNQSQKELQVEVSGQNVVVTDAYSGQTYQAQAGTDGKWYVNVMMPSLSQGGTMLLEAENGQVLTATLAEQVTTEVPVEAGYFRVHFKSLPSDNLASLGLWTWGDVKEPSSTLGSWPTAAISFLNAKQDDYGYYLDIQMASEDARLINLLINNTSGQNITGDKVVERISQSMDEVWFDENYQLSYYPPIAPGYLRINYFRTDGNYDQKGLWVWGDVQGVTLGSWPDGLNFENEGKYGRYIDVKLTDLPNSVGFLLLDESQSGDAAKIQSKDYIFTEAKKHSQIFLRDADATIYTNPYFVNNVRVTGVSHTSLSELEASFTTLEGADKASLLEKMSVTDKDGQAVRITDLVLDPTSNKVRVLGDFNQEQAAYTLKYGQEFFTTRMSWQLKDSLYAYDGELGARVSQEGGRVDLTLWSPSADSVSVIVYDKDNQTKVIGKVSMTQGAQGQWDVTLADSNSLGITDYRGYYYHYEIVRDGQSVLVLDPYAKSLAEWNSELAETDPAYRVAKAAFVDPKQYGPADLTYASIPNFTKREDAIIYEAHVRDFTSDPSISSELTNQFGTFAAFAERLSYLRELGVTHIQLLPVMSYYYVNELKNAERMSEYASSNSNYNWGYDPQSYFALTGMYSTDPRDPGKRIEEFKNLVNEIHKQGMGVILDVVYNHTAKTFLFEDLEPNYYHFMEPDGTAKTSFGGGRLGTTHYMSRRVLVDSIKYLVDEYKVDGFRFDMMGDHDAAAIELAFAEAQKLNPNMIMLGEGWRTFTGDTNQPVKAADQDWMGSTDTVAVFSDEIRNTLKSGYPNEGQPAFLTNGARDIWSLFQNIKAQPGNFLADDPGDVIQYIAAHDNLTLFDIIAQSIKKDPSVAENYLEILQRQRLGNLLVLTSQGTPFIHSGQEYGRTKQFRHPDYQYPVSEDKLPNKAHLLTNADGTPFDFPYYIHDSYDSSDAINKFDWTKARDASIYPENARTQAFTKGLIELRKSTDAFRLGSKDEVNQRVSLISVPGKNGIGQQDLVIAYQVIAENGDRYAVFVNADMRERQFVLDDAYRALLTGEILVDSERAGTLALTDPTGVRLTEDAVVLNPLTATIIRLPYLVTEIPTDAPTTPALPELDFLLQERQEEEVINFTEEVRVDPDLPVGQTYVLQEGQNGKITRTYQDVLVGGQLVATNLLNELTEGAQARIVVQGGMVTEVPTNAPTTPALPELDFLLQERQEEEVIAFTEEVRVDSDLPVGQSYVLQEGQNGKLTRIYQDVLVGGQVIATNLLTESAEGAQARIVVQGGLVTEVPTEAPTTPALPELDFLLQERQEEEVINFTEEVRVDPDLPVGQSYVLQEGQSGKLTRIYQDVLVGGQVVATNLLTEMTEGAQTRIVVQGDLVTEVPETAPTTEEKPVLDFTTKERQEEEVINFTEEVRVDPDLPVGQTYVLQEGQNGKITRIYQDVLVGGQLVATNLLTEMTEGAQTRIVVQGGLVSQVPTDAPTTPALPELDFILQERQEEEVINFTEEVRVDPDLPVGQSYVLQGGQNGKLTRIYQDVLVGGQVVATNLLNELTEGARARIVVQGGLVTEVPETAPTTEEKPVLDFTTKERQEEEVIAFTEEVLVDPDLPVGQSYILQEGQNGKLTRIYQDVLVGGQVVATNLLNEMTEGVHARIVVQGGLVTQVPTDAPTTPALPELDFLLQDRQEEEVINFTEEVRVDPDLPVGQTYVLQEGQAGYVLRTYQDVLVGGQVVATNLLTELIERAQTRIVVQGGLVTEVPETAPTTEEKPVLNFTTKERQEEEVISFTEEVRVDPDLPVGQSYILQEGQAGYILRTYQDVLVGGQVIATNLLTELTEGSRARIVVQGGLVTQIPTEAPTTPALPLEAEGSIQVAPSGEAVLPAQVPTERPVGKVRTSETSLPQTGTSSSLALIGLGLAGLGMVVGQKRKAER